MSDDNTQNIDLVVDVKELIQASRPDYLVFLGRKISVLFLEEGPWGSDVYGDFFAKEQRIRILEGLTPVEELDTFLHELMHMVMYYMRVMMGQVDEEMIVHRVASGISSVLVENPHVLEYIRTLTECSLEEITNEDRVQ